MLHVSFCYLAPRKRGFSLLLLFCLETWFGLAAAAAFLISRSSRSLIVASTLMPVPYAARGVDLDVAVALCARTFVASDGKFSRRSQLSLCVSSTMLSLWLLPFRIPHPAICDLDVLADQHDLGISTCLPFRLERSVPLLGVDDLLRSHAAVWVDAPPELPPAGAVERAEELDELDAKRAASPRANWT
jgi:hypothetical protein